MPSPGPRYLLTLRPEPGDSLPDELRLRRLLKFALRSCGLRCERVETVEEEKGTATDEPHKG